MCNQGRGTPDGRSQRDRMLAGAVVVRDLPANVIAVGNPAQVTRSL
jgi:hypothetical protein